MCCRTAPPSCHSSGLAAVAVGGPACQHGRRIDTRSGGAGALAWGVRAAVHWASWALRVTDGAGRSAGDAAGVPLCRGGPRPDRGGAAWLECWRYCYDSCRTIFGSSLGDAQADGVLAALKRAGEAGLSRSDLTRDVLQGHTGLARVLALLKQAGLASCRRDPASGTAGRPVERWYAEPDSCERSERIESEGDSLASLAGSPRPESGPEVFEV
jgi:hypothetical protein